MSDLVFVQMSGAPGAGKSTLAHAIAPRIGALVLDQDVSKSALLDAGVSFALAGKASYEALGALARELIKQGQSVIFDSPCFYVELLERGQRIARETGARYRYIECVVDDLDELDRRLGGRPPLASQLAGVWAPPSPGSGKTQTGAEVFRDWIAHMQRPASGYLVVDTTRPLAVCAAESVAYIRTGSLPD